MTRTADTETSPPGGDSPAAANSPASGVTPMMAQYLSIRAGQPDCLLFYRMGDFYEMFFEDAVRASAALDIALTKRGKHLGRDVPMCGVPVHAADGYLSRLIRKGFKVAVCEQIEDPAEARGRGAKSVVRRAVTRVVTSGTLTEDALLDARRNNYLAALARAGGGLALAWLDMSTGAFGVGAVGAGDLDSELARLAPGEILISETAAKDGELAAGLDNWRRRLTPRPPGAFDSLAAERALKGLFGVAVLDGFGLFERAELSACGALIGYLGETQKGRLPRLTPPVRAIPASHVAIDSATRRNLEFERRQSGERRGSLLDTLDRTVTGAGGRLLCARLNAPLTAPAAINARLDEVAFFADNDRPRSKTRAILRQVPDIERALSRLSVGRAGPRDLAAVRDGLSRAGELRRLLRAEGAGPTLAKMPEGVARAVGHLAGHGALIERLGRALAPDLPVLSRDGGFIAPGYHAPLDSLRTLRDESRRLIAALQSRYREHTEITGLKVRHNKVLGYFIEVTARHGDRMMSPPLGEMFIHRQTMAGTVRFTTPELSELDTKISRAGDQALALELELFDQLAAAVVERGDKIGVTAAALAALDVGAALATFAGDRDYVRPLVDDGPSFDIKGGRHPVVEAALSATQAGPFVANDCDLGDGRRLWLVTGPNMAGKSTFLRQNAVIAVLAQMGSFVPAAAAHIGVIDRLFSRVGAADDLARGRSTFLVEMIETAAILNQAGPRSLVILDEIGRGTATYDGLSIAWAAIEHLHAVNRCRTLFATHYHELTALAGRLEQVGAYSMRVKEWRDEVVFLHEVAPGAADRSYGIQVARLAGLPAPVIERAHQILATLERDEVAGALATLGDDPPLFAPPRPEAVRAARLAEAVAALDVDALSPRAALEFLYRIKSLPNEDDDDDEDRR